MASPLILANFAQDQTITMNIKVLTAMAFEMWVNEWEKLMPSENTDLLYETEQGYEGPGAAKTRTETDAAGIRQEMVEGYGYTIRLKHFAAVVTLGMHLRKFSRKDHKLEKMVADYNTRSIKFAQEYEGANVLNNGFTATAPYLGGDGYCFFSGSHVWKSGGTYSNLLTSSPFSKSTVEANYSTIASAKMEHNNPAEQHVKKIIFGTDNYFVVPEIYESAYNPETNTNAKNMLAEEKPQLVLNHYLASASSYFFGTGEKGMVMKESGKATTEDYMSTTDERYLNIAINHYCGANFIKPMATYGCAGV